MGILSLAVCWRGALSGCLGSDRRGEGSAADRDRQNRGRIAEIERQAGYRERRKAKLVIAGRDPAKQKCNPAIVRRADLDHDVSILITAVDAAGREGGEEARWNVSMTIMRPPQHGHGCESGSGLAGSAPR